MDQLKTGKFIAACRKEKGQTQADSAERLGITDKAVSKWERGLALPDASIMLALCEILGITVNELLCGERVGEEDKHRNEQLLLDMTTELAEKNKTIWTSMWVIMTVSIIALLAGLAVAAFLVPEGPWQLVVILACAALFLIPCFYALRLEVSVGVYQCKECGEEITPTYREALNAAHLGTTRHLKCPKCNKRTWCKKVWKK